MEEEPLSTEKKGSFTLLELLVTLVIVGILFSFAIPGFQNSIEKSRAKNAELNLESIYQAEKRYRLSKREYWVCNNTCNMSWINMNLTLGISDPFFNYTISGNVTGYTATATRVGSGPCGGRSMTLQHINSTIDVTSGGCEIW